VQRYWKGPRIVHDETIASWTYRCAYDPSCEVITTLDLDGLVFIPKALDLNSGSDLSNPSFDFDISNELFKKIVKHYKLSAQAVDKLFGYEQKNLLDPMFRSAYCAECLKDDITHFGLPAWRRSWCYVHAPFCLIHKRLLSVSADVSPAKACAAFVSLDENLGDFGSRKFQSETTLVLIRNFLAIRVQLWINRLYVLSRNNLTHPHAREMLQCVDLLLKRLLRVPSRKYKRGLARYLFGYRRDSWYPDYVPVDKLEDIGWLTGLPAQRMCALLLLGNLVGLYSDDEIAWLDKLSRQRGFLWPRSLADLVDSVLHVENNRQVCNVLSPFLKAAKTKTTIDWASRFLNHVITNNKTGFNSPSQWHQIRCS
jgi:hypothetical protein